MVTDSWTGAAHVVTAVRHTLLVAAAALGLGLTGVASQAEGQTAAPAPEDAFVAWARDHAVGLTTTTPGAATGDLAPLRAIVGDAQVVLLGESDRDAHQELELGDRLIRFLVEQMGFTVLALEENLATSQRINAYLLRGQGDPAGLVAGMGSWETWSNEEFLALLKWLRAYNRDPAHKQKVRCYGIDITDPYASMQNVLAYLDKVDPQYAMFLRKGPIDIGFLKADSWLQLGARYTRMGNRKPANFDQYVADILGRLAEKRSDYVALSSEVEHAWAVREATCGKRASEFFRRWPTASPEEVTAIRTSAMVDNVLWVFNEVAKGERLIVWAHNIHASRDYVEVHVPGAPIVASMHPMGQSLNGTLAGKVISVGTTFGRHLEPDSLPLGAPSWSVDAALAAVGKPLFMIDLRGAPAEGPVRTWLDTHKTMRGLGGTTKLVPARAYDVLVFIDEIGRATPTAAARARLESMDRARFSTRTTF